MFKKLNLVFNKYINCDDEITTEIKKLDSSQYIHIVIPFNDKNFFEIYKINLSNNKYTDYCTQYELITQDGKKHHKFLVHSIECVFNKLLECEWNRFDIDKLRFDIESFIYNKIENNIPDYFTHIEVIKNGLIIHLDITPNLIHFKKRETIYLKPLPPKHAPTISKIKFSINNRNEILSVYIDSKHVNVDPNTKELCIGNLKYKILNLETINDIINKLHIYNMEDCYYTPKNIQHFIDKLEI